MKELNTAVLLLAAVAVLYAVLRPMPSAEAFAQGMTPAVSTPAPSQSGQLTECFAAKLWVENGDEVSAGKIPRTVKVPPGWVVAGGTSAFQAVGMGGVPSPAMVLCRIPPPPAPPKVLPHADPLGRCSSRDVAEMLDRGMTRAVIEKACNSP